MAVAVVGAGIAGLFAAYHLERAGAEVTVFDPHPPGALSVHAAGIIEPTTAYRTNTVAFLRRVWRFWRSGTCTFRRADPRWLLESARQLERTPLDGADTTLRQMGTASLATYARLAAEHDDFCYSKRGLLERFDDPRHFAEERDAALRQQAFTPVEVRPGAGDAGGLFFPEVAAVHTERFVDRILRELPRSRFLRQRVVAVERDGGVTTEAGRSTFESVVVTTGVTARSLGVPLTAVRGYGWHVTSPRPVERTTIHVDRGIAIVPLPDALKVTGGWDFDLSDRLAPAERILEAVRRLVEVGEVVDFKHGWRPCTPDGLPTVGRAGSVVVANGGFRLGWSFAPAMGETAARLALGQAQNDPFLARFVTGFHGGRFA